MGYDLRNGDWYLGLTISGWRKLLDLGRRFGWHPLGTVLTDKSVRTVYGNQEPTQEVIDSAIASWDGAYLACEGQYVTAEDARNLADALETALPFLGDQSSSAWSKIEYDEDHENSWKDSRSELLLELIEFCRRGSFRVL